MKVAVDIDGTITRYPKIMLRILESFDEAVVLTGHACENPMEVEAGDVMAKRYRQLSQLLGSFRCPIIVCIGHNSTEVAAEKAMYCADHDIDLFIDDSESYCEAVRFVSPKTCILKVYPEEGKG